MSKKEGSGQKSKAEIKNNTDIFAYLLMLIFAVLIVFLSTNKISNEDDIFWHLSIGRYILENKSIPSTDIFSFSTLGSTWIPFEWGWDLINYFLYTHFDFTGISVFNSLLLLIIFAIIIYTIRKFKITYSVSFFIMIVFLFGAFERIVPRPHVFGYLFTVLILSIFIPYRYYSHNNLKKFYFLPFIFAIWANIHMSVLAGLIIFGLFLLSELAGYFKLRFITLSEIKPSSGDELKKLSVVFVLSLFAILLNPHGITTYEYVYSHITMKHIGSVNEWLSPFNPVFAGKFYIIIYIIILISGVTIFYYAYKKKDIFAALIYIAFGFNSIRAIRYSVDYLVIIIIYFILAFNFILSFIKNTTFKTILSDSPVPKLSISVFCLLLIITIPGDKLYHQYLKYPRFEGTGIDTTFFPSGMFNFMKENNIVNIGEKPFNSYEIGGYFMWNFSGKLEFIDSRAVNEGIMNEYNIIFSRLPGFEKKIQSYGFDYAMCVEKDMAAEPRYMSEFIIAYFAAKTDEWKLVYWDDKSFLFLKNIPVFKEIISIYGYKYVNPYNFMFRKTIIENAIASDRNQVVRELNRKAAEEPGGYYINYILQTYRNKIQPK
jgi:hypothetical protein